MTSIVKAAEGKCQLAIMTTQVATGTLTVENYYRNSIPTDLQPIYKAFGIRFVQVIHAGTHYYIYSEKLAEVVGMLKLYA